MAAGDLCHLHVTKLDNDWTVVISVRLVNFNPDGRVWRVEEGVAVLLDEDVVEGIGAGPDIEEGDVHFGSTGGVCVIGLVCVGSTGTRSQVEVEVVGTRLVDIFPAISVPLKCPEHTDVTPHGVPSTRIASVCDHVTGIGTGRASHASQLGVGGAERTTGRN